MMCVKGDFQPTGDIKGQACVPWVVPMTRESHTAHGFLLWLVQTHLPTSAAALVLGVQVWLTSPRDMAWN